MDQTKVMDGTMVRSPVLVRQRMGLFQPHGRYRRRDGQADFLTGKETTMALITLRQLLDHAAEHGYGVPAFNINNMEQGLAILKAAAGRRRAGDPAGQPWRALLCRRHHAAPHGARRWPKCIPTIPICLHQDHGNNEATCLSAIRHGFTSVMMDGSLLADMKTPASYDYNVAITAAWRRCRALGRRLGRGRAGRSRQSGNRRGGGRGRLGCRGQAGPKASF